MLIPIFSIPFTPAFGPAPQAQILRHFDLPSLEALEFRILEAFDHEAFTVLPELPADRASDMAKLRWLHSAASLDEPVPTFDDGTAEQAEAVALLGFIRSGSSQTGDDFGKLDLRLSGSQLALWRFGRVKIRSGAWGKQARLNWEDLLLKSATHPVIRGLAFRHALCWALADNDESRFAELKHSSLGDDMPDIATLFQKAFAALGETFGPLRLWTPAFEVVAENPFLEGRVWVCPAPDLPPPNDTVPWVVPLLSVLPGKDLDQVQIRAGAERMVESGVFEGYEVYFAPQNSDLEMLGIALFPTLIELDGHGSVVSIKMGDACF